MSATSPSHAPGSAAASKIFLMVAVLLGLLATVLAFFFINQAGTGNTGPRVSITVAVHDMPPNTPLDPARDLTVIDIPQRFSSLAVRCLDTKSLATYKGERVNREILAGQPVMLADIAAVGDLTLEKPYFALTLPAETGMIIPGDFVKIILTRASLMGAVATSPDATGVMPYDATIIGKDEGFKVLAVSGALFKTRAQTLGSDQYSSGTSANKTVTLRVTEAQAREIMSALGSLSSSNRAVLLLCPSAKTAPPEMPPSEPANTRPAPATRP
jgi:Flp pilus assembly protein CpaB